MPRRSGLGFPELRVRQHVFGRLELFTVEFASSAETGENAS
jgi:hypothetical protein